METGTGFEGSGSGVGFENLVGGLVGLAVVVDWVAGVLVSLQAEDPLPCTPPLPRPLPRPRGAWSPLLALSNISSRQLDLRSDICSIALMLENTIIWVKIVLKSLLVITNALF